MLDKNTQQENTTDENGNPTGGFVKGIGLDIVWQSGPLGRGQERQIPNGAFVETVIEAARQRIQFYQEAADGKFANIRNENALIHLQNALWELNQRTIERESRQVEGTHKP